MVSKARARIAVLIAGKSKARVIGYRRIKIRIIGAVCVVLIYNSYSAPNRLHSDRFAIALVVQGTEKAW